MMTQCTHTHKQTDRYNNKGSKASKVLFFFFSSCLPSSSTILACKKNFRFTFNEEPKFLGGICCYFKPLPRFLFSVRIICWLVFIGSQMLSDVLCEGRALTHTRPHAHKKKRGEHMTAISFTFSSGNNRLVGIFLLSS